MHEQLEECIFCKIAKHRIILENEYAVMIRDGFPVTKLHSLIIPKRHVEDYFLLDESEVLACNALLRSTRRNTLEIDDKVEGFNIGINSGSVAGQTVFHCHIHLIPRRRSDVLNPKGGVRNLIPGKGGY